MCACRGSSCSLPGRTRRVTFEEYVIAEEAVRAYAPWAAAMRARGADPDDVYIDV